MFESTVLADDDRRAREVASAIEVGAYGEAYRLATELVAERPEDARAHELASAAAIETYRYVEARRHLDKALVLRPGDTRLLGQRAALRLGLADEAGARADAELAVVTDAREVVARGVLDELMLTDRARERLAGADPRLETGSPAAFVDALCAAFARRDIDGVAGSFDPSFLDDLAAQLSPAQRATSPDPLRSFAEGIFDFAANAAANGQQFFGWWVVPEAKVEGDVTWIDVQLPSEVTYTANSVAMFAAAAADPTARESVEATMRARYDGVAPEERPAMLERMVGLRVRNLVDVRFAVRRTGDVWKVTDVVANGVSMKRLSGNAVRIAAAATPATSPTTRVGRDAARVLGILALGVAALIAFFYYARRRDAAERRWRRERARR